MKSRILYLITLAERGGAQAHVLDLLQAFAGVYDIHLGAGRPGLLTDAASRLGISVHILPSLQRSINPVRDYAAYRECRELMRRLKPDLVHAHSSKAGIVGRFAGSDVGVPVVFTAHGWGFTPGVSAIRRWIALRSERAAAARSRKIICVSDFDRDLALRSGVGTPASLVTINYGIAAQVASRESHSGKPPLFVMVARFNEQKDQATLIRAVARLRRDGPDLRVAMAGDGPQLEDCRKLADSLGVADRVEFLGDRDDIVALLQGADAFVLSTHYEGFPISILEAMRAGLPVIATDVNGVSEEVLDGETGILVPRSDPVALTEALRRVAGSPELRTQLGAAGARRFREEFTLDRMIGRIAALYQEIIGSSVSAAPKPEVSEIQNP